MKSLTPLFSLAVFGVLLWALLPYSDAQVVAKPRLIPPPTQNGPNVKPESQSMIAGYARKALHNSALNHREALDYRGNRIHVLGGGAMVALWTDDSDTIGNPKQETANGPGEKLEFSVRVQLPKIEVLGWQQPLSTLKRVNGEPGLVYSGDLAACADPTGSQNIDALSHCRIRFQWDRQKQLAMVTLEADRVVGPDGKEKQFGFSELDAILHIELIDHNTKTRYIGRAACFLSLK